MKNNWVFKIKKFVTFDHNSQKETIRVEQRRNFRGEVGDRALVLQFIKSDWEFSAQYVIEEIDIKDPEAEIKVINIRLSLVAELQDRFLDDYIYSLRRVTNFKNPINHFRNKYNRLSDTEFDGILYDKIYQKRTIVGTILNAMHRNHQESFLMHISENAPEQLLGNVDMEKVFALVIDYLNFAVIRPSIYLTTSVQILKELGLETKDMGFSFNADAITPRTAQMITPQINVINELISQMPGYNNLELEGDFLEIQDDPKFKRLFRNAPLPLTLNQK
jgi:hypothetical protein